LHSLTTWPATLLLLEGHYGQVVTFARASVYSSWLLSWLLLHRRHNFALLKKQPLTSLGHLMDQVDQLRRGV